MPVLRTALLLALLLALPGRAFAGWEVVRLTFGNGWEALPVVVAMERGFFVEQQLAVSAMTVAAPDAVARSLAAGTTDFAAVPQGTLLMMAAGGLPATIVALNHWDTQMELVVPAAAPFASLEDLAGQTVAVATGSNALPTLVRLLNRAGVPPTQVAIKPLPPTEIGKAFTAHGATAVLAERHLTAGLAASGAARTLLPYPAMIEAIGLIGAQPLLVRSKLVEAKPEVVQRFVNAWVKALVYINQAPEDAARLLQIFFHRQGMKLAKEEVGAWLSLSRFDRYAWTPEDTADTEFNGWALHQSQVLPAAPRLAGYVDNRFAERAWQALEN